MICSVDEYNTLLQISSRLIIIDTITENQIHCHIATNEEMCAFKTQQILKKKKNQFTFSLKDQNSDFDFVKQHVTKRNYSALYTLIDNILSDNKISVIKEHRFATSYDLAESRRTIDTNMPRWKKDCIVAKNFYHDFESFIQFADSCVDGNDDDPGFINKFTLNS